MGLLKWIEVKMANRNYSSKLAYLRKQGATIGDGPRLNCDVGCLGSEPYLVTIGEKCLFAAGVSFFTHDGGVSVINNLCMTGEVKMDKMARITVGDNVYIGANAMIMPGVTIGSNCIIGAGAIVSRNIPDNCVAVGAPARPIKTLEQYYDDAQKRGQLYPTLGMTYEEKRKYLEENVK